MINGAVRPLHVEILLNEVGAFAIDRIHEFLSFLFTLAAGQQAPHFVFPWRIEKHAQGIGPGLQKLLRTPAHDDAVPTFRGMFNHASSDSENSLAIDEIEFGRIYAALITSAHKGFEQPIVQRIGSFFSDFDYRLGTLGEPGDLLGQQLVPEFPAELIGKFLSDLAAAASVFAFNGDDFDHLR